MFNLNRLLLWCAIVGCCLGCGPESQFNAEYGKINSRQNGHSLNGVSVLADMFEEKGFSVERRQKISPRLDRFETLVWFPNDLSCPRERAIEALNQWLDAGYSRTLIYVGRDYDCSGDYLAEIQGSTPVEMQNEIKRRIAESKLAEDFPAERDIFSPWFDELDSCQWFEREKLARTKSASLSGGMVVSINSRQTNLEISTLLVPNAEIKSGESDWRSETLLKADGHEFVIRLSRFNDEANKILVVSNGSFLLNYALVNHEHRKLAGQLIDQCDPFGDVCFLESDAGGINVSDSINANHNAWAWISKAPLRYIVPHFLMWGVMFFFVCFPIFGRSRSIPKRTNSSFRVHINALGKLLARSNHPTEAFQKVRDYLDSAGSELTRRQQQK